jgi:alpha-L-fucosidase
MEQSMSNWHLCACAVAALARNGTVAYQPDWDSLKAHRNPEWFRNAKLGIYTHWGPVTYVAEDAPASMESYGNQMYVEKHAEFGYHKQRFGDRKTVGYKDAIPKFTAPKFNADEWADYDPADAFDAADGKNADLYGNPHEKGMPPNERFLKQWLAMVDEVLAKYKLDLTWFDFELHRVIPVEYQRLMFAHTINWAAKEHREIGVAHKFREIHQYTGILDFERGREDKVTDYAWLTDIVSKNGCLLLNVGPHADGSIPPKAREMPIQLGDWMKVNGEAIYGTRPWKIYGEGPTRNSGGGFSERKDRPYTAEDIRFTTKDGNLYAIALDWPASGKLLIRSVDGNVSRVSLLGSSDALKWARSAEGLAIELPAHKPGDYAFVFKIKE